MTDQSRISENPYFSKTDILNRALDMLGSETIEDFNNEAEVEASPTAKRVFRAWDGVRKQVFLEHDWNDLRKRVKLDNPLTRMDGTQVISEAEIDGRKGQDKYLLPNDFLGYIQLENEYGNIIPGAYPIIENGFIYTNITSAYLVYKADDPDITRLRDPNVKDLLELRLASSLFKPIREDDRSAANYRRQYQELLMTARHYNDQTHPAITVNTDAYINYRDSGYWEAQGFYGNYFFGELEGVYPVDPRKR